MSPGVVVGDGAVGKVSPRSPRRPPWSRSLLIEPFKQDLSIDILHNERISCTHNSSRVAPYRRSYALPISQGEYVPTGAFAAPNLALTAWN